MLPTYLVNPLYWPVKRYKGIPINNEDFINQIEVNNSSLKGFSCLTQNPSQITRGIIKASIKISNNLLKGCFILEIFLENISLDNLCCNNSLNIINNLELLLVI